MVVDILIWLGFLWFLLVWTAIAITATGRRIEVKYGFTELIGVVCFFLIIYRYW
jgi:hypothetical protein